MNDIQIFNSSDFGEVRTVMIDGEPWFVGKDVATALGYKKVAEALKNGVDEMDSTLVGVMDSMGREQQTKVINESGLYSLIFGSKLESAKKFKKWVTSEVLPQLRKTGSYGAPQLHMSTAEQIRLLAQGNVELNQRIEDLSGRMNVVENELPLLPVDADKISNAARKKGAEVLGGKNSEAYKSKSLRQNVFADIYGNLKYNFGITGTYKKLKRSQADKAVEIVRNYQPPLYLKERIEEANIN